MNRPSQKITIYRTLYTLNQGIELVLLTFSQLEELGVLRPDQLRSCRIITEELQAKANHEVTEALRKREDDDSVRLQNLRLEWEAKLRLQGNNVPTQKRAKTQKKEPAKEDANLNANKLLPVRQKIRQ